MTLQNVNLCIIIDRQIPKGRGKEYEKKFVVSFYRRGKMQYLFCHHVYYFDGSAGIFFGASSFKSIGQLPDMGDTCMVSVRN